MTENKLIKTALFLSWFTIIYNLLEGLISIHFGLKNDAFALAGFGGDSLIEVLSATLVLWRFKGESDACCNPTDKRERIATFGIGALFILLSSIVMIASCYQIMDNSHPKTTLPGIIISAISLSFMVYLWRAKKKLAVALNSSAISCDAKCSLACIKLSGVLLAGSLVFAVFPKLFWADAIAAAFIGVTIGREGIEIIQTTLRKTFSTGLRAL